MSIEDRSVGLVGPAGIGRVLFSRTGRTIYYRSNTPSPWTSPVIPTSQRRLTCGGYEGEATSRP